MILITNKMRIELSWDLASAREIKELLHLLNLYLGRTTKCYIDGDKGVIVVTDKENGRE